ncbi:MAG: ATP-binding cassette domain-containing protein [Vicingaceae bacterium]
MEPVVQIKSAAIFHDKVLVLKDVDVTIYPGEFVYLIGKTGSGKSSFLKTLYGELKLNEGEGHIAGTDLNTLKSKKVPFLRRKLGIVFQDFQLLFDRSVYNNLLFVLKATGWKDKTAIENRINEVLEMVGLATKGFKMPHELSGGEQQRVAIARALLNEPEVILADEPTGNLDPETSAEIMQLLIAISKKGKAVLMATHDFHLMEQFPSRTIKCENQTIIESGITNNIEKIKSPTQAIPTPDSNQEAEGNNL